MDASPNDINALIREKYQGDKSAKGVTEDLARLHAGEPLAYVIGTIPFLGVSVHLDSHPLIPRPETEWWAEELIGQIGNHRALVLDMCAGSGAIGLAVLKHCPQAEVIFSEIDPRHSALIQKNIQENGLDLSRARICTGDLFAPFTHERFDYIATNPPYIPEKRVLDESVTMFEPEEALFGGSDGLDIIRRIVDDTKEHLTTTGELWIECDVENIQATKELLLLKGYGDATIRTDQYGRERIIVAHL